MADTDTTETFAQRQARIRAEVALDEQAAIRFRDNHLAGVLRIEPYQVSTVIDLTGDVAHNPATGAYVVEYNPNKRGTDTGHWYAAIVGGKHVGRTSFYTRPYAILHALAHLDGDSGHRAAPFAARVLGIPADDPSTR